LLLTALWRLRALLRLTALLLVLGGLRGARLRLPAGDGRLCRAPPSTFCAPFCAAAPAAPNASAIAATPVK